MDGTWLRQSLEDSGLKRMATVIRCGEPIPSATYRKVSINGRRRGDCHMWARAQGQRSGKSLGQHEAVPNLLPPTSSYRATSNTVRGR